MQTLRLRVDPDAMDEASEQSALTEAAQIIRSGGAVALPTETVYGLGANALDVAAVAAIFMAKGRPGWDPLIVHICDEAMLATLVTHISEPARLLMEAFWPGPLTLLLPRSEAVPDAVTAGRALVGVRMPRSPIALELICRSGVPIAAPSANTFGHISPTTAQHVLDDLDGRIDAIVDGGPTTLGLESTVVDPNVSPMVIYRPGVITIDEIRRVAGDVRFFIEEAGSTLKLPEALPSPGVGLRHYAPSARLILVDQIEGEEREDFDGRFSQEVAGYLSNGAAQGKLGVMLPTWLASEAGPTGNPDRIIHERLGNGARIFEWGDWADLEALARNLFAGLRELDVAGCDVILCPLPAAHGIGDAIRDRLLKAARR